MMVAAATANLGVLKTVGPSAVVHVLDALAKPAVDVLASIVSVQSGSGDPAPDNARPISGFTGVTVTHCGKNLFPISQVKKSASNLWIGSDTVNATPDGSFVLPAGTYTFSTSESQNGLYAVGPSGTIKTAYNKTAVSFTLTEKTPLRLMLYKTNVTSAYWDTITVQLEVGSGVTAYEQYSGNTYSVSWQTEAGTVYGGTLDLTAGLLAVTHAGVNITATNRYEKDGGYYWNTTGSAQKIPDIKETNAGLICNRLIKQSNISVTHAEGKIAFFQNGIIRWKEQGSLSLVDYNAYLVQNPLQIVYEMATPQTYQLTPTEIMMLLGENNVWADTGNATLSYYGLA